MTTLYSTKTIHDAEQGLTDQDVVQQRTKWGMNSVAGKSSNPLKIALSKLWAPVPWMLEAAIIFQLVLGDYTESAIVAALLLFNALLGYSQESSAQKTLATLKSRLALNVTVRRNGIWTPLPAAELVPGDYVKMSVGEVVAADVQIIDGNIQVDQSMLTGESIPAELIIGTQAFAGSLVQRGEAVAVVITTGTHTKYGRTAELVQSAQTVSSQQTTVMHVVRNLFMFNGCLIILMVTFAWLRQMNDTDMIHLVLTCILASIPVALPATFTLAAAIGAKALAKAGVLPTRLSAVDEAASMDVLCVDKTGTLTCNSLTVNTVKAFDEFTEAQVLHFASMASSDGGADPVDQAICLAADKNRLADGARVIKFIPFDPATKMAQATIQDGNGAPQQLMKGALDTVVALIHPKPVITEALQWEHQGYRVLAVAMRQAGTFRLCGLIALSDPPRSDSRDLINELNALGIRVLMVTGDASATAQIVAQKVGLRGADCSPEKINPEVQPDTCATFSGVLPEDKFKLVKIFQGQGHTVGMCGDGTNDAPALRQAQIGIAVFSATDVAKSAAGIVLTQPGLSGVVEAIKEGRIIFQRILTYTLNSITKKVVQVLFLLVGLLLTDQAILTPMLMAIIMITGDFLGMALTTDNVMGSQKPNVWKISQLTIAGILMGMGELLFCVIVLILGTHYYSMPIESLRSLAFITIVFGNQGTTYNNRTRSYLWTTRPCGWLVASSCLDIFIAGFLAIAGIAMTALPLTLVFAVLAASIAYTFLLDLIKVPLFARLTLS